VDAAADLGGGEVPPMGELWPLPQSLLVLDAGEDDVDDDDVDEEDDDRDRDLLLSSPVTLSLVPPGDDGLEGYDSPMNLLLLLFGELVGEQWEGE
jgi:hypothetical protein